ncbi:MAG: hypothetical protein IT256_01585 [Chitinophagaceae bacterium]|nr:hypothetical protein [Chitinophagaceae bacterium]
MKLIRKFLVLLTLLLFANNVTNAQRVLYSEYAPYDVDKSSMSIVGKVGGTLYTFRSLDNEYFLDAYDDAMNKTATVVLDFFPAKIYNVRFVAYPNKILVLYQRQEGTRITQYIAMLNEVGILQGRPLKVEEKRTSFFGTSNREVFSSAISENKEHLVVYSAKDKGKTIQFNGYWIDLVNLKVVKKLKLKHKAKDIINHSEALVDNEGHFYLPVYTSIGNRNFSDEYTLLHLSFAATTFNKIHLGLGTNFLEYPFQKIDNINNKIHFASFYSTKRNGNNEGVAAATFDINTKSFDAIHYLPFDDEMRGETKGKRRERALNEFRINQLIVKSDGGFVVAAEEIFTTTQSTFMPGIGFYSFYYSPMMNQVIREYHYNDIMLLSYDAQSKQEWHTFLRKEQYSQEDGGMFSSYSLLNTGGGLGFMFNDFNNRRSRIQLTSVSATGQQNVGYMDAGRGDDPDWLPRLGKQIDAREIVVPCLRKKQICFAKIVL